MAFRIDGGVTAAGAHAPLDHTPPAPSKGTAHEEKQEDFAGKLAEQLWGGTLKALQVAQLWASSAPAAPTQPAAQSYPTDATYRVGPPQRPPIFHDNGFLQNPNDSRDPNPMPTRSPSVGDRLKLAKWKAKLELAEAAQGVPFVPHNDIADGLAAYRHFLEGGGRDRDFSYERFVEGDTAGRTTLNNATRDIQLAAENKYAEMLARDPSLKDKPVTFRLTGGAISVGADPAAEPELAAKYPYPTTENWQKAIGAHKIWMSGDVTVTPASTPGGRPRFTMDMTLHAEDRYNFNPGAADIATQTPDSANGVFEQTGLAHQYMNYAALERRVGWERGRPQEATSTRPNPSRDRQPQDNHRARNRT